MLPQIYSLKHLETGQFAFYKYKNHTEELIKYKNVTLEKYYNTDNFPSTLPFYEGSELLLSGTYQINYITPFIEALNLKKYKRIPTGNYIKLPTMKYKLLVSLDEDYYDSDTTEDYVISVSSHFYEADTYNFKSGKITKCVDYDKKKMWYIPDIDKFIKFRGYLEREDFENLLLILLKMIYKKQYRKIVELSI